MQNFDQQIAYVPAGDIRTGVTIRNIRTVFDEDSIRELADSIYNQGLMSPLVIQEVEDSDGNTVTELVGGERRLRAIRFIQENLDGDFMSGADGDEDYVPCITYVGDLKGASFVNAVENIIREEVDDVDVSAWIFEKTQEGISQTEIAENIKKPLQWVNFRHLFHERSCQELKDLLREGLISFTAAYELSKNVDQDEQKKRVKKARNFNEKISIEEARNAGDPNKTAKPSKKQRDLIRARLEGLAEADGRSAFQGAALSLRWVDGLITDEEMEEFLEMPADAGGED